MTHNTWLLMELAAQRISQELRDAEAARRARLAEYGPGPRTFRARPAGAFLSAVWVAVRGAAYAVARAVR